MKRDTVQQVAQDLHSAKALMDAVAIRLKQQDWFAQNWLVDVHFFPPLPQAESVTVHVFRPHWFNESGQGIHFEAQFGAKQWLACEVPVMLHVFHSATIPGTKIKRIAVTKPLVDGIYDMVASWPGYSFRVGRYGAQSFSTTLKMTVGSGSTASQEEQFQAMVTAEISRLCLALGPAIDTALAQALG